MSFHQGTSHTCQQIKKKKKGKIQSLFNDAKIVIKFYQIRDLIYQNCLEDSTKLNINQKQKIKEKKCKKQNDQIKNNIFRYSISIYDL